MALDASGLGLLAARLMEALEQDEHVREHFPDGVELADAMLIIELRGIDRDGDDASSYRAVSMSHDSTKALGMSIRAQRYWE